MSRDKIINHAVAVRTMEYNATMAAQAITSQTESGTNREIYEHYQKHYKVGHKHNSIHWNGRPFFTRIM
jgi:hypothetical protein